MNEADNSGKKEGVIRHHLIEGGVWRSSDENVMKEKGIKGEYIVSSLHNNMESEITYFLSTDGVVSIQHSIFYIENGHMGLPMHRIPISPAIPPFHVGVDGDILPVYQDNEEIIGHSLQYTFNEDLLKMRLRNHNI